ncbi:MAG: putative immunity protein [Paeniglutamicibacter terrestris]
MNTAGCLPAGPWSAPSPCCRSSWTVIEVGRGWIRGEVPMREAHREAFTAKATARGMPDPVKFAALASGQAVAVAHVAAHDLGATACAGTP